MSASVSAVWLLYFCCYLLALTGGTVGKEHGSGVKVLVKEHDDAVLPCSLSTGENLEGVLFDWRKDGQKDGRKEVFLYDAGNHYNNGRPGQDEQFKGRVSHFQDQLMNGNASIKIQNTKVTDSGTYSCFFPLLQPRITFYIQLVVERLLKDRSGEIPGASKPFITIILYQSKDWSLLQCEVRGASSEPKVEWQDSSGNILPAEERLVSESGGRYYVTIKTTVTKTGRYSCVVTQKELSHQISAETFMVISENPSTKEVIGSLIGGIVIGAVVLAVILTVVLAVLVATKRITVTCNQGPRRLGPKYRPPAGTESD